MRAATPLSCVLVLFLGGFTSTPPSRADVVHTTYGQEFHGIVVSFTSKRIGLDTGFGRLYFDREAEVESVALGDYAWPASGGERPERSDKFLGWLDAQEAGGSTAAGSAEEPTWPPKSVPADISLENEMAPTDFLRRVREMESTWQDQDLSIAERQEKLAAYTFRWTFVAAAVERATLEGGIRIRVEMDSRFYDARTGEPVVVATPKGQNTLSLNSQQLTIYGVDDPAAASKADRSQTYCPREFAERLSRGDGVVFWLGAGWREKEIAWRYELLLIPPRQRPNVGSGR